MFNFKRIKERRKERYEEFRKMWREEVKSIVREAMDEWASEVEYLTPNKGEGRYYCSKPDCEGVRFPNPDKNT